VIKGQIEPFLEGDSLLDIGCGNGMVASLLKDRFKHIQLLDVVEYLPPGLGLPFLLYKEGDALPVTNSFDTVLLLTVLHHSSNPLELLKLAWGATKKKLIIIESVVGIHNLESGVNYELVDSSDDNQIAYAAFVDWFYNRVLHDDVPVPYNFTTPEKWISVFAGQHMKLAGAMHLGQDIDIGPEYHILFALQRE
jgi:SAM-dependent methyltransferase